jgi:hypothetical protein
LDDETIFYENVDISNLKNQNNNSNKKGSKKKNKNKTDTLG